MPFCAYCGHDLSPLARACPQCGHPNEANPEVKIGQVVVPTAPARPVLAGWWIRFLGHFIDGLILIIPTFVVIRVLNLPPALERLGDFQTIQIGRSVVRVGGTPHILWGPFFERQLVSFGVLFVYSFLLLAYGKGRTVGMMAMRLRVTRPDGSPITVSQAASRQLFAAISTVPLYLGYLWAAWDPQKRTWHDMVAGTRVFREPAGYVPSPLAAAPPPAWGPPDAPGS